MHDASTILSGPKYKQVLGVLYRRLIDTDAKPGDKLWTEAELIESLDVSVTTVRKALDELVRQGIVVRKVGKGTFLKSLPDRDQRTARPARPYPTALMLACMSTASMRRDAYFGEIVRSIESVLLDGGHHLTVLGNVHSNAETEKTIDDIRHYQPAGVIMPSSSTFDDVFFARLATLRIPLMLIDHPRPDFAGAQLYFDDAGGGVMAADYLTGRGHRRLAVIAAPERSAAGVERSNTFVQRVTQTPGCEIVARQVSQGGYHELDGYEAMGRMLERWQEPTAVFCAGDLMAYGAIKRLEQAGLRTPDDIAVMGYGDFKTDSLYYPKLTTVRMDLRRLGNEAGRWMNQVINLSPGEQPPSFERVLPVHLVEGKTA